MRIDFQGTDLPSGVFLLMCKICYFKADIQSYTEVVARMYGKGGYFMG